MRQWDLQAILAPKTESAFLNETLGKSLLHVPGHEQKFAALFSWNVVNHVLSRSALTPPRLHVIKGEQELPSDLFCRSGANGFPRLALAELNSLLSDGATMAIDSIEELHEPISQLSQAVEYSLQVPVQVKMYATWSDALPRRMRWNDHDVIVLQISGNTRWSIYGATRIYPMFGDKPEEPSGQAKWNQAIDPGDLLYLPRGRWFADNVTNEPALNLTICFRHPTGLDIAGRIIERLREVDFMRMDYPLRAGPEVHSQYLTQVQAEIVRACNEPGLVLDFLKEMWALAEPRISVCFPWSAAPHMPLPEDHVIVPLSRFPNPETALHLENSVEIVHDGKKIEFDEPSAAIFEILFNRPDLTVRALTEELAGTATRELVAEVLSVLLKHGIVTLHPPPNVSDV